MNKKAKSSYSEEGKALQRRVALRFFRKCTEYGGIEILPNLAHYFAECRKNDEAVDWKRPIQSFKKDGSGQGLNLLTMLQIAAREVVSDSPSFSVTASPKEDDFFTLQTRRDFVKTGFAAGSAILAQVKSHQLEDTKIKEKEKIRQENKREQQKLEEVHLVKGYLNWINPQEYVNLQEIPEDSWIDRDRLFAYGSYLLAAVSLYYGYKAVTERQEPKDARHIRGLDRNPAIVEQFIEDFISQNSKVLHQQVRWVKKSWSEHIAERQRSGL